MRQLSCMMLTLLTPLFVYCANNLTPSINDIMSLEDQKSTGVIRLTQEQKKALAEWFVKHGYYQMQADVNYNQALTVAINVSGGEKIVLSDNSVWDVAPEDQSTAAGWIGSIAVELSASTNAAYPFNMTNMKTRVTIKVKKGTL